MKAILKVFSISLLSLAITSCGSSEQKKEAQAKGGHTGPKGPQKVDGYIVKTKYTSETIEVPGSLVAEEATEIHPEVSGRVTGLYIKEGAQVSKGTLLVKLYDADLQAQKRKLEVQLQIAGQMENRHQQLLKIGGISKEDYETTALNVSNTRADLDVLRTAIIKTEIRAPFSGKLGLKQISIGAYVTPQTIVTTIQKTSQLRIDFSVPEKYSSQIKIGQPINFTVAGSNKQYSASVIATESGVQQSTRSLTIRARVVGNATDLIPGGFAKVKLVFDADPNALMVPSQALIPQARGKQIIVYKNGIADFNDVTTGIRDSAMVQITSGLQKGDTVITTGLMSLKPKAKVIVTKILNP